MSCYLKIVTFFCLSVCNFSYLYSFKDLEEFPQDFVKETKQIFVPGYPHAFNPSIIKWKGRLLLSFRVIHGEELSAFPSAAQSDIGLIFLDSELNPIGEAQFIFLDHPQKKRLRLLAEDARLIVDQEELYVIYSANKEEKVTDAGFRVYVAQLMQMDHQFVVVHNECLSIFEGENQEKREKNWVPFFYHSNLLLAYYLRPHTIFKPRLDGSERCDTLAKTIPSVVWQWGELRGGTPAFLLDENYYLSFFHSSVSMKTVHSNGESSVHYFIGAYLFSSTPPFEIKYISPEPIIGTNFYKGNSYAPYWHPVNVVFPGGLIIEEEEVMIVYGRQDHEIWSAKLDKKQLIKSLIHVSTLKDKE